jgi:hypothetical protein
LSWCLIELVPESDEINRRLAAMLREAGIPVILIDRDSGPSVNARIAGVREALASSRIEPDPDWVHIGALDNKSFFVTPRRPFFSLQSCASVYFGPMWHERSQRPIRNTARVMKRFCEWPMGENQQVSEY